MYLLAEYVLKGIYLGLLLFVAAQPGLTWPQVGLAAVCTFGGLVLFLGVAAWQKLREGYRVTGRLPAFVLFLLLESPGLAYAGILLGTLLADALVRTAETRDWLLPLAGGGALLGLVFWLLVRVRERWFRTALCFALGVALVGSAYW